MPNGIQCQHAERHLFVDIEIARRILEIEGDSEFAEKERPRRRYQRPEVRLEVKA